MEWVCTCEWSYVLTNAPLQKVDTYGTFVSRAGVLYRKVQNTIPGQGCSLQLLSWTRGPEQSSTLWPSVMHSRIRLCLPSPHDLLQSVQDDHSVHVLTTGVGIPVSNSVMSG